MSLMMNGLERDNRQVMRTFSLSLDGNIMTYPSFFDSFLRVLYTCTDLFYVKHDEKTYYNCTNVCSTYSTSELPDHVRISHQDIVCDVDTNIGDCPLQSKTKIMKGSETYFFKFSINKIKSMHFDDASHREYFKYVLNLLNETTPENILFVSHFDINILNNDGANDNHCGSDHTLIELPFYSGVNLGKMFTFNDILNAAYKIKSHKFNHQYEHFCGVDELTYNTASKELTLVASFDHGC